MESTLKNMVLVLLTITFVAAAAVGVVYNVTKGPIAETAKANMLGALGNVLPEGEVTNNPAGEKEVVNLEGMDITVYTAKSGDEVLGYAVETMTKNGFNGEFRLMAGFDAAGNIVNIEVLSQNETPGLGSIMTEPGNVLITSFKGKNPADLKMAVRKDGGDIDAITASTITSRAYIDAVDRAYRAMTAVRGGGGNGDGDTEAATDTTAIPVADTTSVVDEMSGATTEVKNGGTGNE